jgi:hypothetical protein
MGFVAQSHIIFIAELSLWTLFLEVSIEDMLLMAYVDARTTKKMFYKLFLAVPFF